MKRKATWKRLKPVSKKKHRVDARFVPVAVIKQIHERSGGICEFVDANKKRCSSPPLNQPHHIKTRARGGKHVESNLMDVCFFHHHWIHSFPGDAGKLGYLK